MGNIVKLDIMSDGSVSLDGTRITPNKMYGIQSVVKSVDVSKESIINALDVEKEIRAKAIDEFAERLKLKYPYFVEDVGFVEANKMLHSAIDEIAEEMRGAE